MNKRKIWSTMLSLVVTIAVLTIFGGVAVSADASVVESGNCGANGDNVTYTLYDDGLLVISGTGDMNSDFEYASGVPWYDHGHASSIKKVVIESGVTSIGRQAFFYCSNLESITIPETVTSIGYWAFYGSGIESIDLPEYGVTEIEDEAFYNCDSLKTVSISSTINSLGSKVFSACDNLTTVTFATYGNIEVIPAETFKECKKLTAVYLPEGVTSIGDNAFSYCYDLETVTIPDTVTSIGAQAFYHCGNLTTAVLPNSIVSIGNSAFQECYKLEVPNFPNKIQTIGNDAFHACYGLTSLAIPNTVTSIGNQAFDNCENLASVTFADNVNFTTIPYACFNYCPKLESVIIPSGVTSIGASAFSSCSKLSYVVIPQGVTSIGAGAFSSCSALKNIELPDTVTSIGSYAFGNSGLVSITIPGGVTRIEDSTFAYCASLKSVNLPDNLTYLGEYAFRECAQLKAITIPNGITIIYSDTFKGCTNLETIKFPASLGIIEDDALSGCSKIKMVTLPAFVMSIGANALGDGTAMTDIYWFADPDQNPDLSFSGNFNENTKIHVPLGYLSLYQSHFEQIRDQFVGDADGIVDFGNSTHIIGHSITIDGTIGVNFYMLLSDEILAARDTAYMLFTINGKTQKVKVSEASRDDDYYIFRCNVIAKEMTDTITAQMYISEGNPDGDAYTYTVREYAIYILNHQSTYGKAVVGVVNEMLNYGAAAQIYFNYNTSDLANSVVNDSNKPSLVEGDYTFMDPYRITYPNIDYVTTVGDVKLSMASLSLKSTLTVKLYFENVPEGTVFEYKDKKVATTKSGKYTVVTITGINHYDINEWIEVDVSYGETNGTIVYNPLKYIYKVMAADYDTTVTWQLKQVLSSLIEFEFALSDYYVPQQ